MQTQLRVKGRFVKTKFKKNTNPDFQAPRCKITGRFIPLGMPEHVFNASFTRNDEIFVRENLWAAKIQNDIENNISDREWKKIHHNINHNVCVDKVSVKLRQKYASALTMREASDKFKEFRNDCKPQVNTTKIKVINVCAKFNLECAIDVTKCHLIPRAEQLGANKFKIKLHSKTRMVVIVFATGKCTLWGAQSTRQAKKYALITARKLHSVYASGFAGYNVFNIFAKTKISGNFAIENLARRFPKQVACFPELCNSATIKFDKTTTAQLHSTGSVLLFGNDLSEMENMRSLVQNLIISSNKLPF